MARCECDDCRKERGEEPLSVSREDATKAIMEFGDEIKEAVRKLRQLSPNSGIGVFILANVPVSADKHVIGEPRSAEMEIALPIGSDEFAQRLVWFIEEQKGVLIKAIRRHRDGQENSYGDSLNALLACLLRNPTPERGQ